MCNIIYCGVRERAEGGINPVMALRERQICDEPPLARSVAVGNDPEPADDVWRGRKDDLSNGPMKCPKASSLARYSATTEGCSIAEPMLVGADFSLMLWLNPIRKPKRSPVLRYLANALSG